MNICEIFKLTVKQNNLINENDRVLVGLSGGADSVTLLHLLVNFKKEFNISLGAAHINHSLRDTADRDMFFCQKLCDSFNIPLHILKKDIRTEAKKIGESEELYARNVRYSFFESLGYDKIATAHNKNDNAETIIFNFIRGSSLSGLTGIPCKRENIIRPLLDIPKKDIIDFCINNDYEYMTDETNLLPQYTRNKIRLNLIPEIEKCFNKNFVNVVCDNAKLLKDDADFLDTEAKELYDGDFIIEKFNILPKPILRRIIELHFKKCTNSKTNLPSKYVYDLEKLITKNITSKKIDLPNCFEAYISYGRLIIDYKTRIYAFEYDLCPDIPLFIKETGQTITLKKSTDGTIFLPDEKDLKIRSKRNGDFFYPVKMEGKKKLSDYFTDKKIPKNKRYTIPILTKKNEIVSIIGYRNDKRFQNTDNQGYVITIKEAKNA